MNRISRINLMSLAIRDTARHASSTFDLSPYQRSRICVVNLTNQAIMVDIYAYDDAAATNGDKVFTTASGAIPAGATRILAPNGSIAVPALGDLQALIQVGITAAVAPASGNVIVRHMFHDMDL